MKRDLRLTVYGLQLRGFYALLLCAVLFVASCKKEPSFLYETTPVNVTEEGGNKNNVKSTIEFISIAYTDIFGKEIPNAKLVSLNTAYLSFGDEKLIEDMIIRNFLNDTNAVIPKMAQMRDSVQQFVTATYIKLLNRHPNAFEKFYISSMIEKDATISPVMFYYAIMTCNEYRYY